MWNAFLLLEDHKSDGDGGRATHVSPSLTKIWS